MKHAENYILTSEQAREVDRQSIQEFGIPSLVLVSLVMSSSSPG